MIEPTTIDNESIVLSSQEILLIINSTDKNASIPENYSNQHEAHIPLKITKNINYGW